MKGKRVALLWLLPFAVFYLAFQVAPLAWVAETVSGAMLTAAGGWIITMTF